MLASGNGKKLHGTEFDVVYKTHFDKVYTPT